MSNSTVYFSHGKESGPWGTKIMYLAEVAQDLGFAVRSIDYRGMDIPEERVAALVNSIQGDSFPPIFVGSSMGGYVAAAAAEQVATTGIFLMAPTFFMPGYENYRIESLSCPVTVVHGWHDDVVPVDNAIKFARQHNADMHILNAGHRLTECLDRIEKLFGTFLEDLSQSP